MKTIGGRLKSDLRLSGTYTYNSFPLPQITSKQRTAIADAGRAIAKVRSQHNGKSLATLYNPLAMPADLVAAHRSLDRLIDHVFGPRAAVNVQARQRVLFRAYAGSTGQGALV